MQKQGLVEHFHGPLQLICAKTQPTHDRLSADRPIFRSIKHWPVCTLEVCFPPEKISYCSRQNSGYPVSHTSHLLIAAASCQPAVKPFQPSGYKVAFDCWTVRKPQPSQQLVVGVVLQVLKGFPFIPLKTEDSLRPLFEGMLSSSGRRLSTYTNLLSLRRERESCVCCATVADEDIWLTWFHERETLIWGEKLEPHCAFEGTAHRQNAPLIKEPQHFLSLK